MILTGSLLGLSSLLMAQEVKHLNKAEALGAAVSKPQPEYPSMARQFKLEGTVELNAYVNEDGMVEKSEVVSGNPILARAAQDGVKKWRFNKVTEEGKPVKFTASVAFTFKL
jgi:protein TonB